VATEFRACTLDQLAPRELYAVLRLRAEVFVVEQRCAYLDPDGRDEAALHVRALAHGTLLAYARVVPPGGHFASCAAIGRVVVAPAARGQGLGRAIVQAAMEAHFARAGVSELALAAQAHLQGLYGSLGFARRGETYDEDGIAHVDMYRAAVALV
jgi:ElaA protein